MWSDAYQEPSEPDLSALYPEPSVCVVCQQPVIGAHTCGSPSSSEPDLSALYPEPSVCVVCQQPVIGAHSCSG
jgi:hypothetical protein